MVKAFKKLSLLWLATISLFSCQDQDILSNWLADSKKLSTHDSKVISQWLLDNRFDSKKFKISNNDYHSSDFSILVENKQVKSISAKSVKSLNVLNNLSQLSELTLRNPQLESLISCPTNISSLEINGNLQTLQGIESCQSLNKLEIFHSKVIDLKPLEQLQNLENLSLKYNTFNSDALSISLPELTSLNLQNNKLSSIPALSSIPQLKWLDLSDNAITDINPSSMSSSVKELNLMNNDIEDISELVKWNGLDKIIYRPKNKNTPKQLLSIIDERYKPEELLLHEAELLKQHYLKANNFVEKIPSTPSGYAEGVSKQISSQFGLHSDPKISGRIKISQLKNFIKLPITVQKDVLYMDKNITISGTIRLNQGSIKIFSPVNINFSDRAKTLTNIKVNNTNSDSDLILKGYNIKKFKAGEIAEFQAGLKAYGGDYMLLISSEDTAADIEMIFE